jgi:hypothetical protein
MIENEQHEFTPDPYYIIDKANFNVNAFWEDFKSRNTTLDLERVKDVLIPLCTHKETSRLIQELITYGSDADREIIWENTKSSVI